MTEPHRKAAGEPGRYSVPVLAALLVLAVGAAIFAFRHRAPSASPAAARTGYATHVQPILAKYCHSCHGPVKPKAKLDLTKYPDEKAILANRKLWKRLWDVVRAHEMPPEEAKLKPSPEERDLLADFVEEALNTVDPDAPRDPGRVVIRRLNRVEYRNTVRDLVGVDFDPTGDFPADEVGYGFDNIGDVLSIPPLLLEKYLAAAEKVLDRAILAPDRLKPPARRLEAENMEAGRGTAPDGFQQVLFANAEIAAQVDIAQDGAYLLRVRAGEDRAGAEPARMLLKVDSVDVRTFSVSAPRTNPQLYEEKVRLARGKRRIALSFLNDFYDPRARQAERDRNLAVDYVDIVGPVDVKPPEPPASHRRIFTAAPGPGKAKGEAAREILAGFAERAFRRPVAAEEVERLARLFEAADRQGDSFEGAVRVPLTAVLVSPHFLFRVERDRPALSEGRSARVEGPPPAGGGTPAVGDYELASRLSYFLWSTMPDEELFESARQGRLRDPKVLEAQVDRMLKDPRSRELAENFAVQWLQLRRLETHQADPKRLPAFTEKLRDSMRQEVEFFFDDVLREDRSVLALLDAPFTYANEALARHYGLDGVKGEEMRKVDLKDARRGGVLTMAGILMVTSNPTRTSPVKRGKWVLETILGTPPPPPAPDAGELKEVEGGGLTVRQRLEKHRADPNCASCHKRMDPIGFAYENYDAVGAWRDTEDGLPLDVSGALQDGRSFNGAAEFRQVILARKDDFVRTLAEKLFTYALGRGVEYYDAPVLRDIRKSLAENGYTMSALVKGIIGSHPFQHRRSRASEVKDE